MFQFTTNMSEEIYTYLLDSIIRKKMKPGDKIQETTIAEHFNVSRTPVREAIRELSRDGIIDTFPNKQSELTVFDEKRVAEIGITKCVLDRLSVKLAIYYGTRIEYDQLRKYAEQCYESAKNNDPVARIRADSNFHLALCKTGKNESVIKLEEILILQIEYLQATRYLNEEDPLEQFQVHSRILDALESGDIAAGTDAITQPSIAFYNMSNIPKDIYL